MLSQLRLVDDASNSYAAAPPRLPSLRMAMPLPATHFYHHYEQPVYAPTNYTHVEMPYQRPPCQHLPSLSSVATAAVQHTVEAPAVGSPSSERSHKCSLAFILSEPAHGAAASALPLLRTQSDSEAGTDVDSLENDPLDRPHSLKHKRRAGGSPLTTGSKSKYCIVEGCTSRAKHARKCWRHGGSVKCKVQDCINRAKSRGVCWSHGGGTTCSHPNCGTIAVSHGFCWAHGGGKRCEVGGCSRPAYERTQNLCSTHFKQHKAAAKAAVAPY